jgi:hypothetical protein
MRHRRRRVDLLPHPSLGTLIPGPHIPRVDPRGGHFTRSGKPWWRARAALRLDGARPQKGDPDGAEARQASPMPSGTRRTARCRRIRDVS